MVLTTESERTPCTSLLPPNGLALISSGYKSSPFPLKADQQAQVTKILSETGFMPTDLVHGEVDWFYSHLGLSNEFL